MSWTTRCCRLVMISVDTQHQKRISFKNFLCQILFLSTVMILPLNILAGNNGLSLPLDSVPPNQWPSLRDDLQFQDLSLALSRQIDRFTNSRLSGSIRMGRDVYPMSQMLASLKALKAEVATTQSCLQQKADSREASLACWADFELRMKMRFALYRPRPDSSSQQQANGKALFTAYYTPTLEGSHTASVNYPFAIYQIPKNAKLQSTSRVGIDFDHKLAGVGAELFFVKDLFDLYLLHIEGGGKIVMGGPNKGESYYLSYAGTNGQSWKFISTYMLQKGMIADLSVDSQRSYLKNHPEKWREVYGSCPSYVYFKVTDTPPLGSDGVPLTDNRSMATDYTIYRQKGLVGFVSAERPAERKVSWKGIDESFAQENREALGGTIMQKFSRFFIDQDTGGAIKGRLRADLYFGEGHYAEQVAYSLKNYGQMYFFMLRK